MKKLEVVTKRKQIKKQQVKLYNVVTRQINPDTVEGQATHYPVPEIERDTNERKNQEQDRWRICMMKGPLYTFGLVDNEIAAASQI